jgi:hypothetical protein
MVSAVASKFSISSEQTQAFVPYAGGSVFAGRFSNPSEDLFVEGNRPAGVVNLDLKIDIPSAHLLCQFRIMFPRALW